MLAVQRAIVFFLDAQRARIGTSRGQRVQLYGFDEEAQVLHLAEQLVQAGVAPSAFVSGRNLAGEADYKLLHLHRSLFAAMAASAMPSATFLFVSEDSDVLCGALCGPAAQQISIATKLRDTVREPRLLRVAAVLGYIGKGAGVFFNRENEEEKAQLPIAHSGINESVEPSDPPTRKKKDGPFVSTGTKTKLDDSDDEDVGGLHDPMPAPVSVEEKISDEDFATAILLHGAAVDFIFLFVVALGNNANIPPLQRSATKVDAATFWSLYCRKKYTNLARDTNSRSLLQWVQDRPNQFKEHMQLDTGFLLDLLQAMGYSDANSRPPVAEERARAEKFLADAVRASFRYIVGCVVSPAFLGGKQGEKFFESFLDSRLEGESATEAPSLPALISVLCEKEKMIFPCALGGASVTHRGHLNLVYDIDGSLVKIEALSAHATRRRVAGASELLGGTTPWRPVAVNLSQLTAGEGSMRQLSDRMVAVWSRSLAVDLREIEELATTCSHGEEGYCFELRRVAPVASTLKTPRPKTVELNAATSQLLLAAGLSFSYADPQPTPDGPPGLKKRRLEKEKPSANTEKQTKERAKRPGKRERAKLKQSLTHE
jgi:hypothetical protein